MSDATPPTALAILRSVELKPTALTDTVALAYQIAHVYKNGSQAIERLPELVAALQQLAALAQTDARAWEREVTLLWPVAAPKLIKRRRRVGVSTVIGLTLIVRNVQDVEMVGTQTSTINLYGHGDAESVPSQVIPIGLNVRLIESALGAVLSAISALVPPSASVAEETTRPRVCRIASVKCSRQQVAGVRALGRIAKLTERGVVVSELPTLNLAVPDDTAAETVSTLQRVLATRVNHRGTTSCRPKSAPQHVKINYRQNDPITRMLLSAVAQSSSLRELTLQCNFHHARAVAATGPSVAQWLAFALFSRESCHRIRRFVFERGTSRAPFAHQEILDVLEAEDPVAVLFPEYATSIASHTRVRIEASNFVLFEPDDASYADDNAVLADHARTELRIISELPEWWSVVLPGWGQAWVHKEEATITPVLPSTNVMEKRQISDISVTVLSTEELTRSLSWLRFAGTGAKLVSLSMDPVLMRQAEMTTGESGFASVPALDLTDARTAFPNAQKLRLPYLVVESLQPLVDWIAHGSLQHLRLRNTTVRDPDAGPHEAIVTAALGMLASNTQISCFQLGLRPSVVEGTDDEALCAAFAAHDNTPVRQDVCKQRAFLSVLSKTHSGRMQGLDIAVLTDIFRFAGLGRRRVVKLIIYDQ